MYLFSKSLSWFLTHIPKVGLRGLAHLLAFLTFYIFRIRRKLILKNLVIAFPEKTYQWHLRTGYLSTYNTLMTLFEVLGTRAGELHAHVAIKNGSILEHALQEKKGAYILCCHLGNWEVMGSKITSEYADAHIIAKNIGIKGLDRFLFERRTQNGFFPIHKKKKGESFQKIVSALKSNKIVGFAVDQSRPNSPLFPFFNTLAPTNTSFTHIWEKQPAPVIPAWIKREPSGGHTIEFLDPILMPKPPLTAQEHNQITQHIQHQVEKMIRKAPEQYFWFHNRWKKRVNSHNLQEKSQPSEDIETKSHAPLY
ncbi:MAG: lysophospholipid acyltransferase family protein [Oligoflexales bacterium]